MFNIVDFLKNSNYENTIFSDEIKKEIENKIFYKSSSKGEIPYISCIIRKKEIKLSPEELIRQLYLLKLIKEYGYPIERIQVETGIYFGQ